MRRTTVVLAMAALLAGACSDDSSSTGSSGPDTGHQDAGQRDASGADAEAPGDDVGGGGDTGGGDDAGQGDDAGEGDDAGAQAECLQLAATEAWRITYDASPSIEYSSRANPEVEGEIRDLSVLFERYAPDPIIGTYELGTGANANFGTCPQCVFLRTDTAERAYFADRGTLVSNTDPYSRAPDFTISNLRLIEVTVDPETRASTPVADGRCIEVAEFTVEGTFPPQGWSCPTIRYKDGEFCDCECGVVDPDCYLGSNCLPGDTSCNSQEPLPIAGCDAGEVCAADPTNMATSCFEPCDWQAGMGCTLGTCALDTGAGEGDLCIQHPERIAPDVGIGEACPTGSNYQVVCNVVDGFARGYCGPNDICRSICEDDADCTEAGHTCRIFSGTGEGPGYCGPEPVDG